MDVYQIDEHISEKHGVIFKNVNNQMKVANYLIIRVKVHIDN